MAPTQIRGIGVETVSPGSLIRVVTDKGDFTLRVVDPSRCLVSICGATDFGPAETIKIDARVENGSELSTHTERCGVRSLGTVASIILDQSPPELVVSFADVTRFDREALQLVLGKMAGVHVAPPRDIATI